MFELPTFYIRCSCSNFTCAIEFRLLDRLTVIYHQAAMTGTIGYYFLKFSMYLLATNSPKH